MTTLKQRTSRYAAIETLYRLKRTKLPISQILDRVCMDCNLTQQDRQLTMKICFGVLRKHGCLDHLLQNLCKQPIRKIHPFAYQALLTGLYQLFFLDRIPPSAAVNETINALKAAGLPKPIQGFVNGVLRTSLRRLANLPASEKSNLLDDDCCLNHPAWLVKRWQMRYGQRVTQQICAANDQEPLLTLRITHRTNALDYLELLDKNSIRAAAGTYAPDSVVLPDYQGLVEALPGYSEGYFQVQDQASQLAALLFHPIRHGSHYLDCCAGVGGKTTHLASLTALKNCRLTAIEPTPARFRQLQENLQRTAGDLHISIHNESLERFSRSCMITFDGILIDAPCSGTGVIGRHPDIRWNREEHELKDFQIRQLRLLEAAAALLAPKGSLVYATCSIEPEENEDVVNTFLEKYPQFTLADCSSSLPQSARKLVSHSYLAPLPIAEIDGFFAAKLTWKHKND